MFCDALLADLMETLCPPVLSTARPSDLLSSYKFWQIAGWIAMVGYWIDFLDVVLPNDLTQIEGIER